MSDSLVWHLIRDNNCFLHKRGKTSRSGQVQFSSEPGNLLNVNTFKYSGIANSKTIDIQAAKNGDKHRVVLTKKNARKTNKPAKASQVTPLTKHKSHSLKVLNNGVASKFYRRDLASAAAARYGRVRHVVRIRSGLAKKAKTNNGRD